MHKTPGRPDRTGEAGFVSLPLYSFGILDYMSILPCLKIVVFQQLSLRPHGLEPPRLLCPWDSPCRKTGVGCNFLLQRDSPGPGIEPMSPALAGGFFTSELPGKPLSKDKYILKKRIRQQYRHSDEW